MQKLIEMLQVARWNLDVANEVDARALAHLAQLSQDQVPGIYQAGLAREIQAATAVLCETYLDVQAAYENYGATLRYVSANTSAEQEREVAQAVLS